MIPKIMKSNKYILNQQNKFWITLWKNGYEMEPMRHWSARVASIMEINMINNKKIKNTI